ncbi:hypothetical protein [Corynebacterium parakroppenstedtii]|uniref:hypothetical protein n=1 Tax=Corynebacterium parakroppenstedtii TaxID=2828363 RepID=UPI001C8F620C|nr:hypothetical protein [Corynebacterium parakroppenstedtii]MBY0795234.1 hypothetical protein [Corynebacterium parakroppenstedtii]
MPLLNVKTIEERVKALVGRDEYDDELLFEILSAYGRSNSSITRLRNGSINVAEDPVREYAQKNIVYYRNIVDPRETTDANRSTTQLSPLSEKLASWKRSRSSVNMSTSSPVHYPLRHRL